MSEADFEEEVLSSYNIIDTPIFTITASVAREFMTELYTQLTSGYLYLLQVARPGRPAVIDPSSPKPYVTTLMDVSENGGDVSHCWINVYRKKELIRFEASALFPDAPDGSSLRWGDPDLQGFEFRPGCLASLWVESSTLGISFLKGFLVKDGNLTPEELQQANMGDFCLRLLVQPRKGVYDLNVSVAVVPLNLKQLRALPVYADLLSLPCIKVWRRVGHHSVIFRGQQSADNGDGLPAYPVLIVLGAIYPMELNTNVVRQAMYSQWRGMDTLNMVTRDEWRSNMYPPGNTAPRLTKYT